MSTTTDTRPNDLEAWLAQERDVRARIDAGVGPGVARPEQVAGKTGLQIMQGLLAGELPYAHMAKTLDFMMDGPLYAHASTACLVFEMPSPPGNKP